MKPTPCWSAWSCGAASWWRCATPSAAAAGASAEPVLLRSLDDHLAWLTAEIETIEAAIAARLEALAATRERAALLVSVPGMLSGLREQTVELRLSAC